MPEIDEVYIGEQDSKNCTAVAFQSAVVSVPVFVKPKATTGEISTFCCGEPRITTFPHHKTTCGPKQNGCSFILTQNICIEIPIEFSADAIAEFPHVECKGADDKKCEFHHDCEPCKEE
ncbi:MAG: hypothetical protein AB7C97_12975 [Oscillospiraceae bacterium]